MKLVDSKIAGLTLVELDTYKDDRGSFREAYQQAKLKGLGLETPNPVQMNVAESKYGVIRGIHAEPWDKYIHVVAGEVFAAIVDFRKSSETFGQVETFELNQDNALFLPKGLGNSYAVTSGHVIYTYLVPEYWSADGEYDAVRYDDSKLGITWPIPKGKRIVSEKDQANPTFEEAFGG
ncbi:dTDP-4-keto-6-deoxy-D-glucose epimerase [Patescibacteria group bacterium]|nr:dTDP-4-keto-6-deoxy-D-glucose epimerase [Patescibacteria group bacterium]